MPTLKDIAKEANVSYGTVSNVINKRGNVSLEKIKLVEEAVKKLGYTYNTKASSLRSNKKEDITLIIPSLANFKLKQVFELLSIKLKDDGFNLKLYVTHNNPVLEKEYLNLSLATSKAILINSCLLGDDKFYETKINRKTPILFIESKQHYPFFSHVSFNYQQFIFDLNKYIDSNNYQKVLLLSENNLIDKNLLDNKITLLESSNQYNLASSLDVLNQHAFDLIVTTSLEKANAIITAKEIISSDHQETIITLKETSEIAFSNFAYYLYNINDLVSNLLSFIDNPSSFKNKKLDFIGFKKSYQTKALNQEINILMIESPSTNALLQIKPFLEKLSNLKINIDVFRYNDYDNIFENQLYLKYDLMRIDMAYLPNMAPKLFKPLNNQFLNFNHKFIKGLDDYMYVNDTFYSLPFDISSFVLMYRDDILNEQAFKRNYYEKTKLNNVIPTNLKEYNTLEEFIVNQTEKEFYPSTVCYGASITVGNEFLARASNNNILNSKGELNLDNKEVADILDKYYYSVINSKTKTNTFWNDVIKEYSEGKTLLSMVYTNYIHLLKDYNKELLYNTKFTHTPSSNSLVGGGVFGLSKNTNKDELCYIFLKNLYSDEISKLLISLGATLPTKNIFEDIRFLKMYPWLSEIPTTISLSKRAKNKLDLATYEYEKLIGRKVIEYINNKI